MLFVQFVPPRGRRVPNTIDVAPEIEALAKDLVDAGWSFEIELLGTGFVNMDCCDDDGQLAMELVPNGPGVPPAVARLVTTAHMRWTERGRPRANGGA